MNKDTKIILILILAIFLVCLVLEIKQTIMIKDTNRIVIDMNADCWAE